jgi:hypothetical protein
MQGVPFCFAHDFGADFGFEFVEVFVDQVQAIFSGLADGLFDLLSFFFDGVADAVLYSFSLTSQVLSCSMSSICSRMRSLYRV